MTDLSPAAKAVLTAFSKHPIHCDHISDDLMHGALPAALRAVADQVVPEDYSESVGDMDWDLAMEAKNHSIRDELLSIADQLEAQ